MKIIRGSLLLLAAVFIVALAVRLFPRKSIHSSTAEQPMSMQMAHETTASDETLPETNLPPDLPPLPQNIGGIMRFSNLTESEQKDLIKKFRERLRPAAEKWYGAYDGRVPFHLEDLTFDKFVDRGKEANGFAYTFVFNGITLEIEEYGVTTRVSYMMTKSAAKKLNDLPQGTVPSAQMPVNQDDIIRMVKADTGVEFQRKDVTVRPTGLGTAMSGGAFVDVAPLSPGNAACKVSLVFNGDGTVVYYLRDPFF